jgi:hypothetical protein
MTLEISTITRGRAAVDFSGVAFPYRSAPVDQ